MQNIEINSQIRLSKVDLDRFRKVLPVYRCGRTRPVYVK